MYGNNTTLQRRLSTRVFVDIIIWFTVAVPVLIVFLRGQPYERGFFCEDVSISFPYKEETLSTPALLVAGFIISFLVITITEVLNCISLRCRNRCLTKHRIIYNIKCYAVFLTGFIIQQAIEKIIKNQTGVLRPNFFAVCKPQFNESMCPGYITNYTCTGSNLKEIRDSRLSFPSGHSTFAMYIAVFFSLYMEDRLHISFSFIMKLFLQAGLVFIAILCGVDRVTDNKHHPSDVVAGFVLGLVVAVFVYQKLGRKVLYNASEETKYEPNASRDICSCGEVADEVEPQTPCPLLANEELDTFSQDKELKTTTSTQLFLNTHFKARRHFSTPITPTFRPEGVV